MRNPIVELVEKEMAAFRELRLAHPSLFPPNNNLYPVPFFGDIRRAEVVTLALNPAHPEFSPDRHWPVGAGTRSLTPVALTNRLLSYFHNPTVRPHRFFNAFEEGLSAIGCSYKTNAAHLDVHPYPTHFAADLGLAESETLRLIVNSTSADHMIDVLALCQQVKLIVVKEFHLPGTPAMTTFQFVRDRLLPLAGLVAGLSYNPPLIDASGHGGIAGFLLHHQAHLTDFLRTAPALVFSR
jgi:hypothetical protein